MIRPGRTVATVQYRIGNMIAVKFGVCVGCAGGSISVRRPHNLIEMWARSVTLG